MKISESIERYRFVSTGTDWDSFHGEGFGAFKIPGPCGADLQVIASSGDEHVPWEHVSVSTKKRCPNWQEMSFVKDLFWEPEECVMQLHPPRSMWINTHPYCLHLWRPLRAEIPMPPMGAV